jgi:hypothetical protein
MWGFFYFPTLFFFGFSQYLLLHFFLGQVNGLGTAVLNH